MGSLSNTVTAVLLLVNGILLGIIKSNYVLPVPFLLAAYIYFMTPANSRRRFLAVATLMIVAFSLLFGLSYLTAGLSGSSLALAEGIALVVLNTMITALVLSAFLRKTTP